MRVCLLFGEEIEIKPTATVVKPNIKFIHTRGSASQISTTRYEISRENNEKIFGVFRHAGLASEDVPNI
jgi:hypothetical protein